MGYPAFIKEKNYLSAAREISTNKIYFEPKNHSEMDDVYEEFLPDRLFFFNTASVEVFFNNEKVRGETDDTNKFLLEIEYYQKDKVNIVTSSEFLNVEIYSSDTQEITAKQKVYLYTTGLIGAKSMKRYSNNNFQLCFKQNQNQNTTYVHIFFPFFYFENPIYSQEFIPATPKISHKPQCKTDLQSIHQDQNYELFYFQPHITMIQAVYTRLRNDGERLLFWQIEFSNSKYLLDLYYEVPLIVNEQMVQDDSEEEINSMKRLLRHVKKDTQDNSKYKIRIFINDIPLVLGLQTNGSKKNGFVIVSYPSFNKYKITTKRDQNNLFYDFYVKICA